MVKILVSFSGQIYESQARMGWPKPGLMECLILRFAITFALFMTSRATTRGSKASPFFRAAAKKNFLEKLQGKVFSSKQEW